MALLAACDSVRDVIEEPVIEQPPRSLVLQGTITGLGSRRPVVLQYNGTDTCVDTQSFPDVPGVPCRFFGIAGQATTTFSFGSLPEGTAYDVKVTAQPYGKVCSVRDGTGVLGVAAVPPSVHCVDDPAVPRFPVTVRIAPEVAAIPTAVVSLATEEGVQQRSAFGAGVITFPAAVFDSGTNLPVFKYFVTATTTEADMVNNCHVGGASNETLDAQGQDTTVPPAGAVDDVEVTLCTFTVSASVEHLPRPGQGARVMPPGGMELGLRRARSGAVEQRVALDAFTTVSIPDVRSNHDAIYELAITRQPQGMHCVVGSNSQYQWGGAVLLLDPLDANRTINHGWIIHRHVRCRELPDPAAVLRGSYHISRIPSGGGEAVATRNFLTFFADGTYLYAHHAIGTVCTTGCGVEHGFYRYDAGSGVVAFDPVTDTTGATGLSGTASGAAVALPLTQVVRTPGDPARIDAIHGGAAWRLDEPVSVPGEMAGTWATDDHRRVWIFDAATYRGTHVGVNGLGNVQDGCFNIADVHAASGSYTRRGNATTCDLGPAYFTLDVPNAGTVPRSPDGFVGKWPQAGSNADGRPSSPVNYDITPGLPDRLRIRETVNGAETLDGITPVSPEIVLHRTRAH